MLEMYSLKWTPILYKTLGYVRNENNLYTRDQSIRYIVFEITSIVCAYKQTWCEKVYAIYVYQTQYDLLEYHCKKTKHNLMHDF